MAGGRRSRVFARRAWLERNAKSDGRRKSIVSRVHRYTQRNDVFWFSYEVDYLNVEHALLHNLMILYRPKSMSIATATTFGGRSCICWLSHRSSVRAFSEKSLYLNSFAHLFLSSQTNAKNNTAF